MKTLTAESVIQVVSEIAPCKSNGGIITTQMSDQQAKLLISRLNVMADDSEASKCDRSCSWYANESLVLHHSNTRSLGGLATIKIGMLVL